MSKMSRLQLIRQCQEFQEYQKSQYELIRDKLSANPYAAHELMEVFVAEIRALDEAMHKPVEGEGQDIEKMLAELAGLDTAEPVEYQPDCLKPVELVITAAQRWEAVKTGLAGALVLPGMVIAWPFLALSSLLYERRYNKQLRYAAPVSIFAVAGNKGGVVTHDFVCAGVPFIKFQASHPIVEVDDDKLFARKTGVYFHKNSLEQNPQRGHLKVTAVRSYAPAPEAVWVKLTVQKRNLPHVATRIAELRCSIGKLTCRSIPELSARLQLSELRRSSNQALLAKKSQIEWYATADDYANRRMEDCDFIIDSLKGLGAGCAATYLRSNVLTTGQAEVVTSEYSPGAVR